MSENEEIESIVDDILDDSTDQAPSPTDYARESYAWAYDAYWAYENMGRARLRKADAPSPARWIMYRQAKADPEKFLNHVLPKAMILLEKSRSKEGDSDEVQRLERKSIDELRLLLRRAVKESEGVK